MIVLGIETSCDETGVALYDGKNEKLLANALYSQADQHALYGGVVPELASRDHLNKLTPLLQQVLDRACLRLHHIDAIAYTAMPGLIGALMIGAAFSKTLAYMLDIPSIAIHHLEGHLLSPLLECLDKPSYPYVALLISGGHTQLIKVSDFAKYELLGESIDDAAGEAFDKIARLLGLPYPGGAHLAKLATKGHPHQFNFPRPMCDRPGYNFSFSGLKTSVLRAWQKQPNKTEAIKANIANSFQKAVVDTICIKCNHTLKATNIKNLVIAGGVSSNDYLRLQLKKMAMTDGFNIYYPALEYCTDNGAMIAIAGAHRLKNGYMDKNYEINVKPKMSLIMDLA